MLNAPESPRSGHFRSKIDGGDQATPKGGHFL
jgi:hypothetical protein